MIKLKSNTSELSVLLSFCKTVEAELTRQLYNNRRINIELLQRKADVYELKTLIEKIEIKKIKTRENPAKKKIALTITPTQSLLFIKYSGFYQSVNQGDSYSSITILATSNRISKLLTNI